MFSKVQVANFSLLLGKLFTKLTNLHKQIRRRIMVRHTYKERGGIIAQSKLGRGIMLVIYL